MSKKPFLVTIGLNSIEKATCQIMWNRLVWKTKANQHNFIGVIRIGLSEEKSPLAVNRKAPPKCKSGPKEQLHSHYPPWKRSSLEVRGQEKERVFEGRRFRKMNEDAESKIGGRPAIGIFWFRGCRLSESRVHFSDTRKASSAASPRIHKLNEEDQSFLWWLRYPPFNQSFSNKVNLAL